MGVYLKAGYGMLAPIFIFFVQMTWKYITEGLDASGTEVSRFNSNILFIIFKKSAWNLYHLMAYKCFNQEINLHCSLKKSMKLKVKNNNILHEYFKISEMKI